MGGRSTRLLSRVHRTFASNGRGGTRRLAYGGFGKLTSCRPDHRAPFHFNSFAALKRTCVRANLDRVNVASCGHVLSLSSTVTVIDFHGSRIGCRHGCFISCPSDMVMLGFATSHPNVRGLVFDCNDGPRTVNSVGASNPGHLLCANHLGGGRVGFTLHVRTVGGKKDLGAASNGFVIHGTSRIVFLLATSASCGLGFGPSFGSPGACINPSPSRAALTVLSTTTTGGCGRLYRQRGASCARLFNEIGLRLGPRTPVALRCPTIASLPARRHLTHCHGKGPSCQLRRVCCRFKQCLLVTDSHPNGLPTGLRKV